MKHYKYNIKMLNMAIKNSHVLRTFHLFNTLGSIGLGLEIYTGKFNTMPILFYSATIFSFIKFYKTMTKLTKDDLYYMDNKEEIDEAILLYSEYLEDIAGIISKVHFNTSLELVHALDKLLKKGAFSNGKGFEYHKYEETEHEILCNLLGTFVLEGHGVCRHTTMFMSDLLNKMGIDNFAIPCYFEKEHRDDFKADHVMLGIVYGEHKFAYDFTHDLYGRISDDNESITLVDCLGHDTELKAVIVDNIGEFKEYINYPNLKLEEELPKMNHFKIFDNVGYLYCKLIEYSNKYKKNEEIVAKTLKLMPRK